MTEPDERRRTSSTLADAVAAAVEARASYAEAIKPVTAESPLYASLRSVLDRAYRHASVGKGKERHASGEAFEDQPIVRFGEFMRGSIVFNVGQAAKKAMEAERLPKDAAIDELIGAINYLAGAVIILERKAEATK